MRSGFGSISLTTAGSVVEASRAYYAYGAQRAASGDLKTDRTFTGQKRDATGLLYYNARYYDPALGAFISPDSLMPDASRVIDYNRFLYARGNPLKYSDPTGHNPLGPEWVEAFKAAHGGRAPNAQDRADRLASLSRPGLASGSTSWTDKDWKRYTEAKKEVKVRNRSRNRKETIIDHNGASQVDTTAGSSPQGWGDKLKSVASNILHAVIPPGGNAIGVTGSTGFVVDFTGEAGIFVEKSGDSYVGLSFGVGGTTGANADIGLFYQVFPGASSVRAMDGWTVNVGLAAVVPPPAGGSIGGELNVVRDQETGKPTVGATVIGGVAAKGNIPFPPVEFYGNATHTWFVHEFNLFDALGLPRPDQ